MKGKYNPNARLVKKTYKYKNGAIYDGEWSGGFRHGRGVMTWPDGAVYSGEWRDG